jgi:hypothetical protein
MAAERKTLSHRTARRIRKLMKLNLENVFQFVFSCFTPAG